MTIRVDTPITSSNSQPGSDFRATVVSPVNVGGVDLVPENTTVLGTVSEVVAPRKFGTPSGVSISIDRLTSPTGESVNISAELADDTGRTLPSIDNLPRGSRLQLRVTRSFLVSQAFVGGSQGDDMINTAATVSQAQIVLRDLGFYSGSIDGRLTPATRAAIALFQRDQRLTQTGFLDRTTLERLGLLSQSGGEVSAANVISANAAIRPGNALEIRIVTQGINSMALFEDHFRQRDALHIYVRAYRPNGGIRAQNDITVSLTAEEWRGVNRIVVHGSGNDIVIRSTDVSSGALSVQEAAELESQIQGLLTQYAQALGIRYNRFTGQLTFSSTLNYRENETELLFALNSAAATARLYTQLLRTSNDQQAIAGASDVFVAQANAVERAISRTKSGRAISTIQGWQALRDDFRRLDEASSNEFQGSPAYR